MSQTFLQVSHKTAHLLVEEFERTATENNFKYGVTAKDFIKTLDTDKNWLEFNDIDYLKTVVEDLRVTIDNSGSEFVNVISDIMFTIETDYQAWHGLDEDDWERVA